MKPIRVLDKITKFFRGDRIQDLVGLPQPLTTHSEERAEQRSRRKVLGTSNPKERLQVRPDGFRNFA